MAEYTTNEYKTQKRRESRSKIREAIFVHEYVQTKYVQIYAEVAKLYNSLNEAYPCKPDLRRTEEFRVWKNGITTQRAFPAIHVPKQKRRRYVHAPHKNIPLPVDDLNHLSDEGNQDSVPTTEIQSPQASLDSEKVMRLEIPLLTHTKKHLPESVQAPVEIPGEILETAMEEVVEQAPVEIPGEILETVMEEVIEQAPVEIPGEILETVMEEVIDESIDTLHPSLLDEVSPEVIDKIIAELREEPELRDIVTELEQQIEIEESAELEIDISDLEDRLEDELQDILW